MLVPVKAFAVAKGRLAGALDPDQRNRLARLMAARVVAAGRPMSVHVVCDDAAVAVWARGEGAEVLWRPGRGLDKAVRDGVEALHEQGVARVIVAHADLPLAVRLGWVGRFPGVTIVPDRRDDGTNVITVPTGVGFRFAYGAGSFRRHAREARRCGLALRVVRDPLLGFDVDLPGDLAAAAEHLPALLAFAAPAAS